MPYTRLSTTASPGRNYAAFQAKAISTKARDHEDSFTRLSVTATPGRRYILGKHSGKVFTELSVQAVPGRQHNFIAKTPAVPPAGRPPGEFTALQVYALPGKRLTFIAKTETVTTPEEKKKFSLHGAEQQYRQLLLRQDEEILEFIITVTTSGLLEH